MKVLLLSPVWCALFEYTLHDAQLMYLFISFSVANMFGVCLIVNNAMLNGELFCLIF